MRLNDEMREPLITEAISLTLPSLGQCFNDFSKSNHARFPSNQLLRNELKMIFSLFLEILKSIRFVSEIPTLPDFLLNMVLKHTREKQ